MKIHIRKLKKLFKDTKTPFAIFLIMMSILSVFFLIWIRNYTYQETAHSLVIMANSQANNFSSKIDKNFEQLNIWKNIIENTKKQENLDDETLKRILQMFTADTTFKRVIYSDISGNVIASDNQNFNISDRKYFQKALKGITSCSDIILDKTDENSLLYVYATPVTVDNDVVGVLCAVRNLNELIYEYNNIEDNQNISITLLDKDNNTIFTTYKNNNEKYNSRIDKSGNIIQINFLSRIENYTSKKDYDNVKNHLENVRSETFKYSTEASRRVGSVQTISGTNDWKLVTSLPYNLAFGNSNKVFFTSILFFGIFNLVFFLVFLYVVRKSEKARRNVEIANSQNMFLSKLSHELRTPVTAIHGLTQIMLDDPNHICIKNNILKDINSAANYLLTLINNALDFNKSKSGKLSTSIESMNITNLLKFVKNINSYKISQKNITYVEDYKIDYPTIKSDEYKLQIILINLITNAIKFTNEKGFVSICVSQIIAEDNNVITYFNISDTGVGMTEHEIKNIFEPFRQADSSITRKFGGTGLGLTLVKEFTELLGGKIEVTSKRGVGSSFTVSIKSEISDEVTSQTTSYSDDLDFSAFRILIAEDNEINTIILKNMLSKTYINMDFVVDGQMAVELFTKKPADYYDLILMDIQMPILDGYKATSQLRMLNYSNSLSIPIIAITANVLDEDIQKAKDVGMNDYITKPFEINNIFNVLAHYLFNKEK